MKQPPKTLAPQCRTITLRLLATGARAAAEVDADTRTVELAFSSEEPVDMWYGTEILSHAPGAMRTGQRQLSMPLLFNHCMGDLLGIVERIWIDADRIGRALVRFGRDERGEWAMQQVRDGVLVNVSFMYRVFKWLEDQEANTLTAVEWEPYELSLVTVPADPSVGVGRSADAATENSVELILARAATPAPAAQSPQLEQSDMKKKFARSRVQNAVDELNNGGGSGAGGVTGTVITPGATSPEEAARQQQQRGAEAERTRIAEIEAICRKYSLPDELRTGMIQKGASAEQARLAAADHVLLRAKSEAKPSADFGDTHNPDMTEREKARYSMIRAVNAALSGDWKKAGFELECHNAIGQRLGRGPQNEKGFFIPTNIPFAAQRATYTVGTVGSGTAGGTLVANNLLAGSFIEVLRNKAKVMQLGATVLSGLVGAVTIPRQTGQSSTYWTAEGVNTTQSEATFDSVTLNMKTIGTFSQITRNMLMQSTPDIDMIARADLLAAIALGVDLAALSGTGSGGQPLGIGNTAGVGSVIAGTNGAAVSIDHLIDMETQVMAANAPEEALAYLCNAKTVGSLKKLKSTTGQYLWSNSPNGQRGGTPGEINGYPVARSNQARSNLTKGTSANVCSEGFFGAWPELMVGEWGVVEIVPNPYDPAVYKNGGILLRVLQSIDIGVRHAASFATVSDWLTP